MGIVRPSEKTDSLVEKWFTLGIDCGLLRLGGKVQARFYGERAIVRSSLIGRAARSRAVMPWVVGVALSGLLLTACSSDGSQDQADQGTQTEEVAEVVEEEATPTETATEEAASDNRALIEAEVAAATGKLVWAGPTEPSAAPKDIHLVMLLCPIAFEGCNVAANAGKEVAEALGWKLTQIEVTDPATLPANFQRALNIGADAILIEGFSDALYPKDLVLEAKKQGIPIVDQAGDLTPKEDGVDYSETIDAIALGRLMANVIMLDTDFAAKLITYETEEYPAAVTYQREAVSWMQQNCPDCEVILTQQFVGSQVGSTFEASTVADVRNNPSANAVLSPFDAFTAFQIPALQAAGLCEQVGVYSYSANQVNVQWVAEENCQAATVSNNIPWSTWAAVDNIIRLLNGQPVQEQNVPMKLFTPANAPSDGVWTADMDGVNYQAEYLKLWGLAS